MADNNYTEDNIRSLDWKEHIRMRPGMYIGKLGDGASADDGIYILVKEVVDNCIDEFVMGNGKKIELKVKDLGSVSGRPQQGEGHWKLSIQGLGIFTHGGQESNYDCNRH